MVARPLIQPPPLVASTGDQNVLLITIDTLRADALGCYGGAARTPRIDGLAAAGARFEFAHAHAVVTLPSHATMLTGRYPFTHGIRDNSGYRLKAGTPTLATILKGEGFATGAFVGAFPLDSRFGLNAGFDEYDDRYGETSRLGDLAMPERRASAVVDRARRWIGAQRGRWFAWVHLYDPHAPYRPPAPYDRDYAGNPYAGEVAYADQALAPLVDLVRSQPRPTLVIVTGDHGEALGSHGEKTHGVFAYEATLRIPLIVAQIPHPTSARLAPSVRGRVIAAPAAHIDIVPTIADALRLAPAEGLPGMSLVPLVNGEGGSADRATYFEALSASLNRGWAPLAGVLVGREKYIDLPVPELYDVRADPGEQRNLLPARADRGRALHALLDSLHASPAAPRVAESRDARRRLQALGYTSGAAAAKAHDTKDDDPKNLMDLDAAIQRGLELFDLHRPREALAVYEDLVRRRPGMALAYEHTAYLQWSLGNPKAAIDTLRTGVALGHTQPELLTQLGAYLAESGFATDAIALLTPLGSREPPDLDALNALGIALARAGRPDEALATFDRIVAVDPTNAAAYQNIGTVRLDEGDAAAARVSFVRALQLDPELPRALNGLGVVDLRSGNRAAAIDAWTRAVAADPTQVDTLYNLGAVLMEGGDRAAARPYLERFLRSAPPAFYRRDLEQVRRWLARK